MAAKLGLGLLSTLVTLLLLEAGFAALHVEPDGFRHTLASQRWYAAHWKPLNRLGFRDAEIDPARLASTRRLFVVGDSFAAGDGIADPGDRFAGRLAERLGADWSVTLLAMPGWNTPQQARALASFPYTPRVLVVSYYLNDIEDAAKRHGRRFEMDLSVRPAWLAGAVGSSSLLNFAYWRVARSRMWSVGRGYADFVYDAYREPAVWQSHAAELDALIAPARRRGALVHAVVFPHLWDLDGSAEAVAKVGDHLRAQGVSVLDVRELVLAGDWEAEALRVGAVDPHPSAALHAAVADALFEQVAQ